MCRVLRHGHVFCLNQCVLVSIFVLKLAQCFVSPDVRVCICVQSVKTCGDVIFPTIKRTIMMQPLLCRKHVCVGVKSSVTLKVRFVHENQKV